MNLEKYWEENKSKFERITREIDYQLCGVWYTEGFLLCSVFDLLEIDLILESGTAYGHSTELMANYFDKEIITVDSNKASYNQYRKTSKRLSKYKNILCKRGDSLNVLPKLIEENGGKKIGIFIDGPKDSEGMSLGQSSSLKHDNVLCVGYHDVFIKRLLAMMKRPENAAGQFVDTKILEFINRDYGYLNNKVFEKCGQQKNYLPNGPGISIQHK